MCSSDDQLKLETCKISTPYGLKVGECSEIRVYTRNNE